MVYGVERFSQVQKDGASNLLFVKFSQKVVIYINSGKLSTIRLTEAKLMGS